MYESLTKLKTVSKTIYWKSFWITVPERIYNSHWGASNVYHLLLSS